ncbi:unnamed protein product [Mytilus coruscus]|uniref:RanBP2-type domain-containing protein n=1 Tax=Mytilus coruscus TaxID=42192 RepID=A0A6J8B7T4_MYTCO|nr:unnamed protein product [Mytilus coruscus]
MWVCLNCHEFNDPNIEKCGKCEIPRQQKEKPKGKHEHKNANFLFNRKTMYTRGNAKGWQKAIQPGYERQSVVGRLEARSLSPTIQPGYQQKNAVERLEAISLTPNIKPGNEQKTFSERLEALSLAGISQPVPGPKEVSKKLESVSLAPISQPIHVSREVSNKLKSVSLAPSKKEHDSGCLIVAALDFGTAYSEDITGKPMSALDVFTLSIEVLVRHLMALLEKRSIDVKLEEIRWVLTVPAIWTDSAKQFMRKGAVQAGIPENNLYIALEPEAASIFCQYLPTEKLNGSDFKMEKPGTKYMVVDLGDIYRTDITVHEKVSNEHLKELSSATGNSCGGTSVDERFLQMFVDIFGRQLMNALKEEDPSAYLDLFLEFETVKRIIGPDRDSKVNISIPYVSINKCCSKILDKDIDSVLSASKYANEISIKGDKMRIDPEIIKDIFNPTIQSIVTLMKDIFDREQSFEVNQILLVGGFSECSLVQDAIKRAFPDKRIINPDEAGLAVLKGACLFGHKPDYIISRVMQYTYGTGISLPFDANIHDKEHLVKEDDGEFCDGLFEVIVRKNDTVDIATAIEHNFTVDCNDQEPWELSLYASTEENPMYVNEKGCTLLGSMKISFSKASDTERELRVAFLFGNTELGVTATDILTGETVSSTFNLN